MKNTLLTLLVLLFGFSNPIHAQIKPYLHQIKKNDGPPHSLEMLSIKPFQPSIPTVARPFSGISYSYRTLPQLAAPLKGGKTLRVAYAPGRRIPAAIYGESASASVQSDPVKKVFTQLQEVKDYLQIGDPDEEFQIISSQAGKNGYTHFKLQQLYLEVPVYGGQLTVHLKDGKISLLAGRSFPSPTISRTVPAVPAKKAIEIATLEVEKEYRVQHIPEQQRKLMGLETNKTELVIYHSPDQEDHPNLAWRVELVPNIHHRQVYFIDAQTGEVLFHQNLLCKIHRHKPLFNGPAIGQETGLLESSERCIPMISTAPIC